jgi:hypothetical protein
LTGHADPGDVCGNKHFSRNSDRVIEPLAESGGLPEKAQFLPSFFLRKQKRRSANRPKSATGASRDASGGPFRRTLSGGPKGRAPFGIPNVSAALQLSGTCDSTTRVPAATPLTELPGAFVAINHNHTHLLTTST